MDVAGVSLRGASGDSENDELARHRRETKVSLRSRDRGKVLDILRMNFRAVQYSRNADSFVNSIYFDDERMTSLHDNIDGISPRFKLRLRWYDDMLPQDSAVFEVKRRINQAVSKDRYPIGFEAAFMRLPFPHIVRGLLGVLPAETRARLELRPQPVILVRYRRRHFVSRDSRRLLRVTLDDDIRVVNQIGAVRPHTSFAQELTDRMIIEIKAPVNAQPDLPRLLHPLRLRRTRFSKYAMGCAHLRWETGIYADLHAW